MQMLLVVLKLNKNIILQTLNQANQNDKIEISIFNKPIDGFMIRSDSKQLTYRVHLRRQNRWLSWVTGYNQNDSNNGFAGILGQEIDALQIK